MAQGPKVDTVEDRLKSHAQAFDGLLSLIPAEDYYGEDPDNQGQRKKQTKAQKRAARKAKLDPQSSRTAEDALDEQSSDARKRKREQEEEEDGDFSHPNGVELEKPLASQAKNGRLSKKQKPAERNTTANSKIVSTQSKTSGDAESHEPYTSRLSSVDREQYKAARKVAKAERKAARRAEKVAARKAKKEKQSQSKSNGVEPQESKKNLDHSHKVHTRTAPEEAENLQIDEDFAAELELARSTISPSPKATSSILDISNSHSSSSSISSLVPSADAALDVHSTQSTDKLSDEPASSKPDPEELKARLQKRIESLRAARKADKGDGSQPRNRQELLESRRRKEEERKAHKKELRRKAAEEERRKRQEAINKGSPLLPGSPLASPGSPATPGSGSTNFSFGRVTFGNGQRASSSLNTVISAPNKVKGPSDPQTALQAAQNHEARLATLDPTKRTDIANKDAWLHAKQRAEGVKVRDDTSLLKKTLKRKEKQKKKSEREWSNRLATVEKGKADKQKKREANLAKRRDDKGSHGKTKKNHGGSKKAKRPGFEGTFRAKAPRA